MKRFIKQILYFILAIALVVGICSVINIRLIKKNILNPDNFSLSDTTKILIIGDSYVGLSLNPEIIPTSDNQTILGEHYLYSYSRLRYFLEHNPQLEYVVLSFNYSTIAKTFDKGLFESRTKSHFFSKEFMLLDNEEIKLLQSNDLVFIRNYLAWKIGVPSKENISLIQKTFSGNFTKEKLPFRGAFIDGGKASHLTDYHLKLRIKECFEPDKEPGLAPIQMIYLQKIISLCKSYNVRLVLYVSPLTTKFYDNIPEYYKVEYEKVCNNLPKTVLRMDYARYQLPDSCFEDVTHLNVIGAEIISSRFLDDLKNLDF
jgi:hypothetical protein